MNPTCIASSLDGLLFSHNSKCCPKEMKAVHMWPKIREQQAIFREMKFRKISPYVFVCIAFELCDLLGNTHAHAHEFTCGLLHLLEPLGHLTDVWNVAPENSLVSSLHVRTLKSIHKSSPSGLWLTLEIFPWWTLKTKTRHSGLELLSGCKNGNGSTEYRKQRQFLAHKKLIK